MTDLLFADGNNPAGHFLIRFVPVTGLLSLPVTGPPVFHPGFRWFTVYGTVGTKEYDEEEQLTDNGPVWSVSISLFLPGDSAQNRQTLQEMASHRFVVECQDNTDTWRRAGTLSEHLGFSYKFKTDADMGGRRGTTLKFSGQMTACPPIVTSV